MFSGLLTILQFIWPFFKEALFGNGTFKVWFRSNYLTVLWFVMMVIMLLVVLALSNILKNAESELAQTQEAITKYRQATSIFKKTNDDLLADNKRLTAEVARLKKQLSSHHDPKHESMLPTMYVSPPKHNRAKENNSILRRLNAH